MASAGGSIFYALISRGKTVLAEYTARSGNFPTITRVLLSRIQIQNGRSSVVYDSHVFHYLVDDGIVYLCLSDEHCKRRITFGFLDDIKARFEEQYRDRARTAIAFAMNSEFQHELQRRMAYWNDNPAADKISAVRSNLDSAKDIMVKNIETVLARGEKIELLVDKTEQLSVSAFKFQKQSKQLKNAMCWKNAKMMILLTIVILIVLWIILSLICGWSFSKCK